MGAFLPLHDDCLSFGALLLSEKSFMEIVQKDISHRAVSEGRGETSDQGGVKSLDAIHDPVSDNLTNQL